MDSGTGETTTYCWTCSNIPDNRVTYNQGLSWCRHWPLDLQLVTLRSAGAVLWELEATGLGVLLVLVGGYTGLAKGSTLSMDSVAPASPTPLTHFLFLASCHPRRQSRAFIGFSTKPGPGIFLMDRSDYLWLELCDDIGSKPMMGGVIAGKAGGFCGQGVEELLIFLELTKAGDPTFKFCYFLS